MPDLQASLNHYDDGMFPLLAQQWGVAIKNLKREDIIKALQSAMLQAERAELVWDSLNAEQRGALQSLLANKLNSPSKMFERLFGEIRKMGQAQIEREQPHKNPSSIAEALYYRGFINEGHQINKKGVSQTIIYIPDDLAAVLPVHKTAYAELDDLPLSADSPVDVVSAASPVAESDLEAIQQADSSIVDDLTTLLAYLRLNSAGVETDTLLPVDAEALKPFLLHPEDERLAFLLGIGMSADLISVQEGRAYPKRDNLQKWLAASRHEQVKLLVEAWLQSTQYVDLWQIPSLYADPDAGFPYDPRLGRVALVKFLKILIPHQEWWSLDEFIEAVQATEPDFQRPSGDYESWYIRNASGDYLHGFDSWEDIEGALLEFYLRCPLHWMGLTDVSSEAVRLTAYGRAFIGLIDWTFRPDTAELIEVQADGIMVASRHVSRADRFQVARFTTWGDNVPPYRYRLDAEGIQRAAGQGITTQHIATFIQRQLGGKPLPPAIARLLETWQGGSTHSEVSFERVLVLRTTSSELLKRLYDEPALRRYLGAKLGDTACIIRAGQEEELKVALGEAGIKVDLL